MITKSPLTVGEVRAWIEGHGLTYASVAKQININRCEMNQALSGRLQWRRGKGHQVAIALRLKAAPSDFNDFAIPPESTVREWLTENQIPLIPHPRTIKPQKKTTRNQHAN